VTANKRLVDLVSENTAYGSVLYQYGIGFYEYPKHTLEQVCLEKGLSLKQVVESLAEVGTQDSVPKLKLFAYPVDLIVAYLRHSHHIFIKQKLPYLSDLISHLPVACCACAPQINDLKFIFPLFAKDFIHHIYEEEDTLFSYVVELAAITQGKKAADNKLYFRLAKSSIQHYAVEHSTQDDEMLGIRQITRNYHITEKCSPHLKVLYAELKQFEQELKIHAAIENEVLFPKALMLEKQIRKQLEITKGLN